MIVDSSVFVALVLMEKEATAVSAKLAAAQRLKPSAVTFLETSMVLLSRGGQRQVDIFNVLLVEIVPVDYAQALPALEAFRRYGKGRDKATLNLSDCFVYALAKLTGEPLLFVGNDFAQTDLAAA